VVVCAGVEEAERALTNALASCVSAMLERQVVIEELLSGPE